MQTTTNYGFNIVEGTDIVNPLTQLNPNFTALDTDLKAVSNNTVDNATCIKTGTVHAVTRTNPDAKVFRFTATGNWNTGDTMTVDGTLVSVYVPDGTAPSNGCFVINTEVLASIQGTRVTLYVNSGNASNISFDDSNVLFTASNVQTAIESAATAAGSKYDANTSVKDKIDNLITEIQLTSAADFTYASQYKFWQSNNLVSQILNGKTLIGTVISSGLANVVMSCVKDGFGKLSVSGIDVSSMTATTDQQGFTVSLFVK